MDSEYLTKFNFAFLMAVLFHILIIVLPVLKSSRLQSPPLTPITAMQATVLEAEPAALPQQHEKTVDSLAIIKKLSRKEKKYLARLNKVEREKFLTRLAKQLADVEAKKLSKSTESAATKEEKIQQALDRQEIANITSQIGRKIAENWIAPAAIRSGISCKVQITLTSDGKVTNTEAVDCNTDLLLKQAAENAVRRASPLPVPADPELFEKNFKSFTFAFTTK